jgi:hypothetical protein
MRVYWRHTKSLFTTETQRLGENKRTFKNKSFASPSCRPLVTENW